MMLPGREVGPLFLELFLERKERWEARRRRGRELRWPLWMLCWSKSIGCCGSEGMGGGAGYSACRVGSFTSEASCTPASLLNVSIVVDSEGGCAGVILGS